MWMAREYFKLLTVGITELPFARSFQMGFDLSMTCNS